VGIISERDIVRRLEKEGHCDPNTPVTALMTTTVYYAQVTSTIEECMKLMTDKKIRHLPVLDGQKIIGMISIGDIVKEIIADQSSTIKSLENYITGQHIVN
jgi:CBS domain-containing protein